MDEKCLTEFSVFTKKTSGKHSILCQTFYIGLSKRYLVL